MGETFGMERSKTMREYISAIYQPRLGVSCRVLGISAFKCLPSPHYNGTRWHMAGCPQSATYTSKTQKQCLSSEFRNHDPITLDNLRT